MKVALIFPPACDPTAPYISLPALTGFLRSNGIDVVPIDANLEGSEHLLQPQNLENVYRRLTRRLRRLERKRILDHRDQMAYAALWRGKQVGRSALLGIEDALSVLLDHSGARFFDPAAYYRSVSTIDAALRLISAAFFPLEMDFTRYRTPFSLLNMHQIRYDAQADRNPFDAYFSGPLVDRIAREQVGLVGVSVAYTSQIQPAYTLAYTLRRNLPHVYLAVGGPAMTQMFLRLEPEKREHYLGPFDTAVLFEGEMPLLDIVRNLDSVRRPAAIVEAVEPVNPSELPPPDFDGLPLGRYFSPFKVLPYDSSRGCYWGKCSFCHYGLAEKGTASYRERPLDAVMSHLEKLSEQHGCRLFYLSQDLMAPKTVHRLAVKIRKARKPWRWATDLRPERYFSPEVCRDLADGGALAVSLGIESGSARILQLIQKGITLEDIESAIQNMAGAGLAVEAMCFTDFPAESHADAMTTLQLLDAHHEAIALFMCGRFQLTEGSAVSARPSSFGIRDIWHVAGDDLRNTLYYQEKTEPKTAAEIEDIEIQLDRISHRWTLLHYPWAGSLSTAHTLLWYEKFGPQIFKHLAGKSDRRLGAASGVFAVELPVYVKNLAEPAYENEARIWYTLIHERRAVTPNLYRQLAKKWPSVRLRKTHG